MTEDAEPWPEAVEGSALLEELEGVLRRFVVLPKWGAETLALWTVHTYAFELREVSTYIGVESPERRCGKTTLLDVLQKLVNRPAVTANISSPAFFRVIGELRPTLMIDEADTFLRGNDTLRGILNAGYTRETAYVVRVGPAALRRLPETPNTKNQTPEKEQDPNPKLRRSGETSQSLRVVRFSCWCPKVIAMIGRLPGTLADRCIIIRMQRKTSGEQCERMRKLDAKALRRKCLRFVRDHGTEIAKALPELPSGLNDRAADIWEPLLAVADLAGGKWPAVARQAAAGLSAEEVNPIGTLLLDIALLFASQNEDRFFSQTLVEYLKRSVDRPWAEMTNSQGVTERWLARQLRPYGILPRTMRIGERQGRGYCLQDFREAFRRYVPSSAVGALVEELRAGAPSAGITNDKGPMTKE